MSSAARRDAKSGERRRVMSNAVWALVELTGRHNRNLDEPLRQAALRAKVLNQPIKMTERLRRMRQHANLMGEVARTRAELIP